MKVRLSEQYKQEYDRHMSLPKEQREKSLMFSCNDFVLGKSYEVIAIEHDWYRIIDESGEDYLYPPDMFEIIEGSTDKVKIEN